MTRADIPEGERRDFFLYVDEFQNFTTGSFASILSEARKFRLSLIVAHQYLAQIKDETADAVWGNVGSIVAFRVGSDDAEVLAQQLGKYPGQITPENFSGRPKYAAYARLLIDGIPSNPFSLQTLPPRGESVDPERAEIIRRVARRRFPQGSQGLLVQVNPSWIAASLDRTDAFKGNAPSNVSHAQAQSRLSSF